MALLQYKVLYWYCTFIIYMYLHFGDVQVYLKFDIRNLVIDVVSRTTACNRVSLVTSSFRPLGLRFGSSRLLLKACRSDLLRC